MEIARNIHLLKHSFNIRLNNGLTVERFVNSIIIFGEKIILIDTGVRDSYVKIKSYIEKEGRSIEEVGSIILSHSHPDHIGSAAMIKEVSDCTIYSHIGEKQWIENIELQAVERPVPGFFDLLDKSVKVDKCLLDGQTIIAEDITLDIIHSPGHSPGSINIFFREENILFTADSILLKGDIPNYDNYKELKQSLEIIANRVKPDLLLSSWKEPVYSKKEQNLLLKDALRYLSEIDTTVKEVYSNKKAGDLENCREVIKKLNMPEFMVNPIVDSSFRSHL